MGEVAAAPAYARLSERFGTAAKLGSAKMLLWWDSQTYMPRGAAATRGEQLAAIDEAAFGLLTAADTPDLLEAAEEGSKELGPEAQANLWEMRRAFIHANAVPADLRAAKTRLASTLQVEWFKAKANKDFGAVAESLGEMMRLNRDVAAAKAAALGLAPYDALMDETDPGVTTALVDSLFNDLEQDLPVVLAEAMEAQAKRPDPIPFTGDFSLERQRALADRLLGVVGQGGEHSRYDAAPHPFALPGNPGDARIATRFDPQNFRFAVMALLHEAGHAAYEFNLPRALSFQPAGAARGATVHESQSLMLEMQAGRSDAFLSWLAPVLHEAFGGSAEAWSAENVIAAYRRVGEGSIRVEADEISYPLHIVLRYRLERALLADDLAVADLPGAWRELSQKLFGRAPPDDAKGVLQDIHWAAGMFAYFPNYALGAVLSAQLFEAALRDHPTIEEALGRGDFGPYFDWVRPQVHARASLVDFDTLVRESTGSSLSSDSLKRHLRRRYLAS